MRLLRQFSLFALAVFAGLGLAACDGGGTTVSLTSIAVAPASSTLTVGGPTTQLTVTGYYSDGRTTNLTADSTFVSSNTSVITVDASGVVTPVAVGTAVVTATNAGSGKTAATELITVNPTPPPTLQTVTVTAAASALLVNATTQLTVTGTYSDNSTKDLTSSATFVVNTPAVASVSATGLVTALAAGTTTITATASGVSGTSSTITVSLPPPPTLQTITVTSSSTALVVGSSTAQLTVTGTYSDGSTQNLTSTSTFLANTAGVVSVSSAGVVTPVGAGTTTITATNGSVSGTSGPISVTLSAPVLQSIAVTAASTSLTVGGATTQLTVTGTYNTGPTQNLTSSATYLVNTAGVVSVSSAGVVTPLAAGTTTITATVSGKSATTATITVAAAASTAGQVYVNGYAPGVSFIGFLGAVNAVTEDSSAAGLLPNGHKSVQFIVTGAASAYSGGAFVASAPQDLHTFNAVTFWAKASAAPANGLNVIGMGDDASTPFTNTLFRAEINGTAVTTAWQQFTIPMPVPANVTALQGLFHWAESNKNYTLWIGDIQYQNLPASGYVAPTAAVATMPGTLSVAAGAPTQINSYAPNTITWTTPSIANGKETQTGWGWYTFASTDTTVATINAAGFINGLKAGTESITASMGALPNLATTALTVTVPLPTPSTIAPTPTVPAANVVSLFGSTYPLHPIDTYQSSWSACCNTLVNPYPINGHNVLQYTLNSFVGITFGNGGAGTPVNASTMTTFHVDVWFANPPPRLQIQLVDFSTNPNGVPSLYNATGLTAGSWIGLEIPLSSFAPAANLPQLEQLLFISQDSSGGNVPGSVIYIDNMYFHN